MKPFIKIAVTMALTANLVACGTMNQINRDVNDTNNASAAETKRLLDARRVANAQKHSGPAVSDLPYVNATAVTHDTRLPDLFRRQVTLNEPTGAPVQRVVAKIEGMLGVRVMYESGLIDSAGSSQNPGSEAPATAPMGGDSTMPNMPPLPTVVATVPLQDTRTNMAITYSGDAKGLLDAVAASMGGQWKWDASSNRVRIFRYVAETFRVAMVPGNTKSSATVGSESGGGGSQSNTTSAKADTTFGTDGALSVWKGMTDTVKQLLSPQGTVTLSEALGTITVRDRWDRVEAVREYIEQINASLSRQVEVDVRVYRVVDNSADTRGLNWNILFNALQTNAGYGFQMLTPRPDATGQGVSSAILSVPETDPQGNPWRYGGSAMFIDALSKIGKATVMTSTSLQTVNNQPAPVKIVQRRKYLAQVTPMYAASGGSAVGAGASLTPDEVETGFKMQILPHVQDDGKRVLLQVMVSISTLDKMEVASSGGESIQLPQVSSREFMQKVWLNNGQTLVLAGFESVDTSSDTSSPFDKSLWALGGTRGVAKAKESIVIVITPAVSAAQSNM